MLSDRVQISIPSRRPNTTTAVVHHPQRAAWCKAATTFIISWNGRLNPNVWCFNYTYAENIYIFRRYITRRNRWKGLRESHKSWWLKRLIWVALLRVCMNVSSGWTSNDIDRDDSGGCPSFSSCSPTLSLHALHLGGNVSVQSGALYWPSIRFLTFISSSLQW